MVSVAPASRRLLSLSRNYKIAGKMPALQTTPRNDPAPCHPVRHLLECARTFKLRHYRNDGRAQRHPTQSSRRMQRTPTSTSRRDTARETPPGNPNFPIEKIETMDLTNGLQVTRIAIQTLSSRGGSMTREYGLFEKFPDGSSLWRVSVS